MRWVLFDDSISAKVHPSVRTTLAILSMVLLSVVG
jgi:hypothetical protein